MESLGHLFVFLAIGIVTLTYGCDKLADEKNPRIFQHVVHGEHVPMMCSEGTVFNQDKCDCDYFAAPPKGCQKKADPENNTVFSVNVHGVETKLECAPGTFYIPNLCECGYLDQQ